MIKNIALYLFSALAFLFLLASSANADQCTTQYGGTTTCVPSELTITKQVKNPITNVFVKNLGSTDATFSPGSEVEFRLTIKNGSGETFNPVTVKDIFPDFLTFGAGPGTFDSASKTLTFTLGNMIAGETRTVEILAKVSDKSAFSNDKNMVCVVNTANASALNRNSQDTAQLCIQTQVLGATTLPVAGFNDLFLLIPFAGLGLVGVVLLKKRA